ncbi:hypothetical protein [Phenylobacterium sp.]|uniref:hypothetical protein n=1 Tax=Phenylobacterium sp. TaxID=1871053 RepID=UPI00300308CA
MLVAEPWDFESPEGRGRLRGQVSKIQDFAPEGGQELTLAVEPISLGGARVTALRALGLHPAQENLIQRLETGRATGVRLYGPGGKSLLLVGSIRLRT